MKLFDLPRIVSIGKGMISTFNQFLMHLLIFEEKSEYSARSIKLAWI
jgi:hypothetical protein